MNEDILGGMEFGCKVAGSILILVSCEAVQLAIDKIALGTYAVCYQK